MALIGIIIALILAVLLFGIIVKAVVGAVMLIIVAFVAGLIATSVLKYSGGLKFTFLAGLGGGILGWVIARLFSLPLAFSIGGLPLIWSILGAMAVVFVAKLGQPVRRRI